MRCIYWVVGAVLLTLGIGSGLGWWLYGQGRTAERAVCLDAQTKASAERDLAVRRAIDQANDIAKQDAKILRASAAQRAMHHRRDARRSTEVTRHVATHRDLYSQRLDPCGLCLKHSAAAGTDPAACPCGGDAAMPTHSGQR